MKVRPILPEAWFSKINSSHIFFFSLCFQLYFILFRINNSFLYGDEFLYTFLARELRSGIFFFDFSPSFMFPILLAPFPLDNFFVLRCVAAVINSLSIVVYFKLIRHFGYRTASGYKAALLAAVLLATNRYMTKYGVFLYTEPLFHLFQFLALYQYLRLFSEIKSPRRSYFVVLGIYWGLMVLARFSGIVVIAFSVLWILARRKQVLIPGICLALFTASLLILPYVVFFDGAKILPSIAFMGATPEALEGLTGGGERFTLFFISSLLHRAFPLNVLNVFLVATFLISILIHIAGRTSDELVLFSVPVIFFFAPLLMLLPLYRYSVFYIPYMIIAVSSAACKARNPLFGWLIAVMLVPYIYTNSFYEPALKGTVKRFDCRGEANCQDVNTFRLESSLWKLRYLPHMSQAENTVEEYIFYITPEAEFEYLLVLNLDDYGIFRWDGELFGDYRKISGFNYIYKLPGRTEPGKESVMYIQVDNGARYGGISQLILCNRRFLDEQFETTVIENADFFES